MRRSQRNPSHKRRDPLRPYWRIQFALTLSLAFTLSCQPSHSPVESLDTLPQPPKLLIGLGTQTHPINTPSPMAQRYFDQGMILTFGFNHHAAIRAFEEAARLDTRCAMCHWGIALALGPNINAPMGPAAAARAFREIEKAQSLLGASGTARERAYIGALAKRYSADVPEDRASLDRDYADAMRGLHHSEPGDVDAATLFAESLMDLYPWSYWTPEGEPKEFTQEIVDVLEAVMQAAPRHVGANHYYIHAVEEFHPEKGEAAADRLGDLAPDAGHLVHMPSHIYWRVGRYADATEINQRAAAADERFFSWCAPGPLYAALYYPHNVHFLWAAASAEGRSDLALMTARKLAAATRDGVKETPQLQEFIAVPLLTLARFARWDILLAEPRPDQNAVYVSGIWSYTRGLAEIRTGATDASKNSLAFLRETSLRDDATSLILAGGTASAAKLLNIATLHLEAEIAFAEGHIDVAIQSLESASAIHDDLPYMEPPPWYAPPRQTLGALLLKEDRAEEAEAVYREDLRQYPKNGWSLLGLAQSLEAQGETVKAAWALKGFEAAWAHADIELESSRL